MGTEVGALLKKLQSYHYKLYDIQPKDKKGLRPVEPADLLTAHPSHDTESMTNLMMLRGGREPPKE